MKTERYYAEWLPEGAPWTGEDDGTGPIPDADDYQRDYFWTKPEAIKRAKLRAKQDALGEAKVGRMIYVNDCWEDDNTWDSLLISDTGEIDPA